MVGVCQRCPWRTGDWRRSWWARGASAAGRPSVRGGRKRQWLASAKGALGRPETGAARGGLGGRRRPGGRRCAAGGNGNGRRLPKMPLADGRLAPVVVGSRGVGGREAVGARRAETAMASVCQRRPRPTGDWCRSWWARGASAPGRPSVRGGRKRQWSASAKDALGGRETGAGRGGLAGRRRPGGRRCAAGGNGNG